MSHSSKKYAAPLHLEINSSQLLTATLVLIHGLAVVSTIPLPIPVAIRLLIVFVVLISLWMNVSVHGLRGGDRAIKSAVWDADDIWHLETKGGRSISAHHTRDVFVFPWLVVINLRVIDDKKRVVLVLMRDAIGEENLRRLRVRLRLTREQSSSNL